MSFYFPPKCHISLTLQRAVTLVFSDYSLQWLFEFIKQKMKMQIFDWINTIKQVCPSKSFRTVNGGGGEWRGGDDGGGGVLFHKVYITVTRELHIALLYFDVASYFSTFSFRALELLIWNFVGMKHVWSPLVYMQFIIACDLFRHCLEVVRLIQISLSRFNPRGGHLADINDKRGICSKLIYWLVYDDSIWLLMTEIFKVYFATQR